MKNTRKGKKLIFTVSNRQKKISINLDKIKKVLEKAGELFSAPPEEAGVIIVSDRIIRKINRDFLKKDTSTDVMSFKLSGKYGEIIISAETALRNSSKYGISLEKEVLYLIAHGYLHLKNYRDYNTAQRKEMLDVQDKIFAKMLDTGLLDGKTEK
jgi:probable rRNA maturation factor